MVNNKQIKNIIPISIIFTTLLLTGCNDGDSETITSSTTGRVWSNKNLGASKVCTQSSSAFTTVEEYISSQEDCFGDYYQWGREADGHEKPSSAEAYIQATSTNVNHGNFIMDYLDWTTADMDGNIRGANWNPCPSGFRVPTIEELSAEFDETSNRDDLFNKLKLPTAGFRSFFGEPMMDQGYNGYIWSSSPNNTNTFYLAFSLNSTNAYSDGRAYGKSIRCIKE